MTKFTPLCAALCLGILLGCGSDAELTGDLRAPATASLVVTVVGLPDGAAGAVTISGAQGYQKSLTESETLSGLAPGQYTVSAAEVAVGPERYAPVTASQQVTVTPSSAGVAQVGYAVITGRLHISLDNLPEGASAQVVVTGPAGFSRTLGRSATLVGLALGSYTISAGSILVEGDQYAAEPALQTVEVASAAAGSGVAAIGYTKSTGRLEVTVSGLPLGVAAAVRVTGPNGYLQTVTASTTLTGLFPGSYVVTGNPVTSAGNVYSSVPLSRTIEISTARVEAAAVAYALSTGSLQVQVSGLPSGTASAVTVTGPGGYTRAVTTSTLLTGLVPGGYTVTAAGVTTATGTYTPAPTTQSATITASLTAQVRSVTYAAGVGSLAVTVAGLPVGTLASVSVSGPGGYLQAVTATRTLTGLAAGTYTVTGLAVSAGGLSYGAQPPTQQVTLLAGASLSATVTYSATTGSIGFAVSGLPSGTAASVQLTGPGGYTRLLTSSQTVTGLVPGSYTLTAAGVTSGATAYTPTPLSQIRSVTAGASVSASVAYAATTGSLNIGVTGLSGVAAAITVTGPNSYTRALTGSQVLSGLVPGSYTVTAASVLSSGITYTPSPASQIKSVTAGTSVAASIAYTGSGGSSTLNLRIDGLYLTQATQAYNGLVPLVAGRDAYLRAFAVANQSNAAQPPVRVRLYSGSTLLQTYTIAATQTSVPTAVAEGTLGSSWNLLVPGSLVQPGLRVLADIDPANGTPESNEADNQFPVTGSSSAVDVRTLPVFSLRFVPVRQQVNGLQGNVTDANKETFLVDARKVLPIGASSVDVRAIYTTTAPALESGNGNGAWGTILSEVLALRSADASTRYYYGVVKTSYGAGIVGMGYVGGSSRTAIGWDVMTNAPRTVAHELGHNMSRLHAPCGGVGNPDPNYPYAGGTLGVFGLDLATLIVKLPTMPDLMGYCQPGWISDYNWKAMMTYRAAGANNAPEALVAGGGGLLVWGRVTDDGIVVEPAFRVPAGAGLAPVAGPHRLDLLADDGSLLRSVRFEATEVADLPGGAERHFAFVIPLDAASESRLGALRVSSGARTAVRTAVAGGGEPVHDLARLDGEQVQVRWDSARYPMVMVKDAATGQVLSFARGGAARLWARGGDFQLTFSDGVKSVTRAARVLR
jgi:hypothetical protein